jgi:hypothetical protein
MQLWLSYEELGDFFQMEPETAREQVIDAGWTRRRCSDGLTRVKLPPATAHTYLLQFALSAQVDEHVSALRGILRQAGEEAHRRAA